MVALFVGKEGIYFIWVPCCMTAQLSVKFAHTEQQKMAHLLKG